MIKITSCHIRNHHEHVGKCSLRFVLLPQNFDTHTYQSYEVQYVTTTSCNMIKMYNFQDPFKISLILTEDGEGLEGDVRI